MNFKGGDMKLHSVKFGLAFGILWAVAALFLGLATMFWGYGSMFVELLGSVYIGYAPTIIGTIIGLVWAFIDGFIGAFLLAWIYNKLVG
jgi:hypothetical protein